MAVYQTLRFESDYSKECDEVEMCIPSIARECKISERKVYHALNELEFEHFIVQRVNYNHFKYGKKNHFNVARDYSWFKLIEQSSDTPASNDIGVQSCYTPAPHAGTTAPHAGTPAQNDIPIDHYSFHQSIQNTPISPKGAQPAANVCEDIFSLFWEVWPNKQNKKRAMDIWKKRKLDKLAVEIITHVEKMLVEDDRWKDGFVPNPVSYLNGDRWNDEPYRKLNTSVGQNSFGINTKSDYHNNRTVRSSYVHIDSKYDSSPETIATKAVKDSFTPEEIKKIEAFKHAIPYEKTNPRHMKSFFSTEEALEQAKTLYLKAERIWSDSLKEVKEQGSIRNNNTSSVAAILSHAMAQGVA
ncbi:MAG TPA: hypothetical protein VK616_12615 [Flavitalea sp.]|nr:hypothetical protein [Flavitalea sp.]